MASGAPNTHNLLAVCEHCSAIPLVQVQFQNDILVSIVLCIYYMLGERRQNLSFFVDHKRWMNIFRLHERQLCGEVVLPVLAALGVRTDLLTLGARFGLDIDTRLLVRIFDHFFLCLFHTLFSSFFAVI